MNRAADCVSKNDYSPLEHAENKLLNIRSELIYKCRHVNKFLLRNLTPDPE